jgi:hypothetical protein
MKAERSLWLPLIVLCLSLCSYAQLWSGVLDPTRATDWTQIGAGTLPTNYVQVGSTIAAYSGTTDTINNALANCDGTTGQFVLLGPGTFNLSSGGGVSNGIRITKSKCVLRGSGPTQTNLIFGAGAHDGCGGENGNICFEGPPGIDGSNPQNSANWTAGYAQGATTITIGANISGSSKPVAGQTMILDQAVDSTVRSADTGNVFVCLASGGQCTQAGSGGDGRADRPQMQFVTVTSVSGGACPCTVGISPGLYMPNWKAGNSPQTWWNNTKPFSSGQGLENLTVDGSADAIASGGALTAVALIGVSYSWIKNIISIVQHPEPVSLMNTHRHVRIYVSHHITVRDSYFVGRAGVDDYGINPYLAGDFLIENNIFQRIGTFVLNEQGAGAVVGYNFGVNDLWHDGTWAQGAIYGHGGQENYMLHEGNIAYGQEEENYFGHGFFITSFRNRYYGFQNGNQNQSVPGFVYGLNRYFNFVGNVMGVNGFHTTYQTVGGGSTSNCSTSIYAIGLGGNCSHGNGTSYPVDDTLVEATSLTSMFRWGNYDVVTGTNRFCGNSSDTGWSSTCGNTSEVPAGLSLYRNAVPTKGDSGAGQAPLPDSFYLNGKPAWWPQSKPWPAIGPDVSGGNVGQCGSNSSYPYAQCLITAGPNACGTGFSCGAAGVNSQVVSNPAMDCYYNLGGVPDGNSGNLANFDANACYGNLPPPPAPPSGLSAQVQ